MARTSVPFGKHKGVPFADVPVEYLDWLIGQTWLRDDLKEDITAHLRTRADWEGLSDDDDTD